MKETSPHLRRAWAFKIAFFFFSILLFGILTVQAQQKTITGTVTDAANQPVSGASVVIKGQNTTGITTNQNGAFSINANAGDVLVISSVGYTTHEEKIGAQNNINVSLATTVNSMSEVVVIGYGTTSRRNLTTAVSKVDPKNVPQAANNSVAQLLFGRAAGLQVSQNSAEPGGAINISIRGRGNPLVVVDGVLMPYSGLEPGSGNRSMDGGVNRGGFAGINPNDIESIEFLKDASAAIYGVNAANGVMIITTKKGKGGKPNVSYDGSRSLVKNMPYFETLSARDYMTYYNQLTLDKFLIDSAMAPFGAKPASLASYPNIWHPYSDAQIQSAGSGTDWLSYVLRDGSIDNHNISVSGSSERFNYYFSGGYFNQVGTIQNSGLKRYTGRLNLTFNLTKFLALNANISGARNNYLNSQAGGQSGGGGQQAFGALQAALAYPATLPVNDPTTDKFTQFRLTGNPVSLLNIQDQTTSNSLLANFSLDLKIIPNVLSARLLYGNNTESADRNFFIPSSTFFDQLYRSRGSVTNSRR